MNALKNLFVVTTLLALMAVPAAAGVHQAESMASGMYQHLADPGLVFEMDNTMPLELAELSRREMIETEGEFVPLAYLAGVLAYGAINAWSYHGDHYFKHGRLGSSRGAAAAAGRGMVTHGIGGGIASASRLPRAVSGYLRVKTFAMDQLMQIHSRRSIY